LPMVLIARPTTFTLTTPGIRDSGLI